ncbi:Nucleotide-binding universal stress protein, UspA family [Dyella jiangningensis]|uniref:universal stress protein n=1 Tax=Dyella sp. AtDHG13 TaxID=1938897 RepID=UPI0008875D1D|nr:universal stress protein [Dyella sp. AtDHG13]PXV52372.1 nucleotide-binding universal stress UspA family protein [Dyella sp. AtDHG13]SDL39067.1 Nucleotide-binding universal stress protein, UspA family [Dyella jiangningensis]
MFKRILLPTDGSELSLRAVDIGIQLAKQLGAEVFAFHAMEPFETVPYFTEMMIFPEDAYEREVNERAQYYLEEIKQRADAAKVPWNGRHEYAHRPYEAIMNIAHEQKCDLIVMGSHGRKGIDKLLLGSQTNKLLLSTDIPVLVCQ